MTRKTRPFAKTLSAAAILSASALPTLAQPLYSTPGFTSPSGNITCYIDYDTGQVEDQAPLICLIFEANWTVQADGTNQVPDCQLDITKTVSLPRTGPARALETCHGDVFWPVPLGRIGYGSTWSLLGYTCKMAQTGVSCSNGGGGFSLSRAALKQSGP